MSKPKTKRKCPTGRLHQERAGVTKSEHEVKVMTGLANAVNNAVTNWEIDRGTYVPDRQARFGNSRF